MLVLAFGAAAQSSSDTVAIDALNLKISALMKQKKFSEAEPVARELAAAILSRSGGVSLDHAKALHILGLLEFVNGSERDAEKSLGRAVEIFELSADPAIDENLASALETLANIKRNLGKTNETAETLGKLVQHRK
jgi:tetratricopeptide (TPR) repeat protein